MVGGPIRAQEHEIGVRFHAECTIRRHGRRGAPLLPPGDPVVLARPDGVVGADALLGPDGAWPWAEVEVVRVTQLLEEGTCRVVLASQHGEVGVDGGRVGAACRAAHEREEPVHAVAEEDRV